MKTFKILLVLAVLISLVYVGFEFARPQFKYLTFKSEMKKVLELSSLTSKADLKKKVAEKIKEFEMPIEENNIIVGDQNQQYSVALDWTEMVVIGVGEYELYSRKFDFSVDLSR
jgi:hypothetical protein